MTAPTRSEFIELVREYGALNRAWGDKEGNAEVRAIAYQALLATWDAFAVERDELFRRLQESRTECYTLRGQLDAAEQHVAILRRAEDHYTTERTALVKERQSVVDELDASPWDYGNDYDPLAERVALHVTIMRGWEDALDEARLDRAAIDAAMAAERETDATRTRAEP